MITWNWPVAWSIEHRKSFLFMHFYSFCFNLFKLQDVVWTACFEWSSSWLRLDFHFKETSRFQVGLCFPTRIYISLLIYSIILIYKNGINMFLIACLFSPCRNAFSDFDAETVANFTDKQMVSIGSEYGIEISRVRGVVDNSNRILEVKLIKASKYTIFLVLS